MLKTFPHKFINKGSWSELVKYLRETIVCLNWECLKVLSQFRTFANSYCDFYQCILKELYDKICNVHNVEWNVSVQKFIK